MARLWQPVPVLSCMVHIRSLTHVYYKLPFCTNLAQIWQLPRRLIQVVCVLHVLKCWYDSSGISDWRSECATWASGMP